jgi:hypothetical protein
MNESPSSVVRRSIATALACATLLTVGLTVQAIAVEAKPKPKPKPKPDAKAQAMPAWRNGMKADVFSPIPGSSPSKFNLDPGHYEARVFNDWCGLQIDEKHGVIYSALGAGHSSQEQNGVYKQNLMVDKPVWEVVRKSTRYVPGQNGTKLYFPDGRPVARHTYYDGNFVDVDGKGLIIFIECIAAAPASVGGPIVDAFHLDTGDWDLNGAGWPRYPGVVAIANCVAKDPRTQNIWVADKGGGIYRLDPATRQWTTISPNFNGAGVSYCGSTIDTNRDRFVFAGSRSYSAGPAFGVWNIAAGKYEDRRLVWQTPEAHRDYNSLVYDPIKNRYLWLQGTGKLRAVDPEKFTVTDVTQAEAAINGPLNRFAFIEALHGCVYLPHFGSEMLFLPVE